MSRTPEQRQKIAQEFQKKRVDRAKLATNVGIGAAGLGLTADYIQGEADEGFSPGEFGANVLLSGLPIGGAVVGQHLAVKNAKTAAIERHKEIYNRYDTSTNEGEFARLKNLKRNKDKSIARVQVAAPRGAAIGAAAMLVPTLLAARDEQKLSNQSASLM